MMRCLFLWSLLLSLHSSARAETSDTGPELDLPIREVTVFSDRARVTRAADVHVGKGMHTLTLPRLPQTADPQSVRVETTGARLLRVSVRHVTRGTLPKTEAQKLIDRLTTLHDEENVLMDHRETIQSEQQFLDSIRPHGEPTGVDKLPPLLLNASGWSVAQDFFDTRRTALEKALAEVAEKIRLKDKDIATAESEANQLLGQGGDDSGYLVDAVVEGTGSAAHLSLTYMAAGAEWHPSYDVRYAPGTKSVEIGFSGLVAQQTGEDWTDARLTLSTAVPATVTNLPKLAVWKIGEQERFIPTPEAAPADSGPIGEESISTGESGKGEDEDMAEGDLRARLEAVVAEESRAHEQREKEASKAAELRDKVASQQGTEEVTVGVGTQKDISVSGTIRRIAVGNPGVSDAKTVGSNELLLLGVAEGETTLLVWLENGTRLSFLIKVRKRDGDSAGRARQLQQYASALPPAPPPPPAPASVTASVAPTSALAETESAPAQRVAQKNLSFQVPGGWVLPSLAADLPARLAGGYEFTYASAEPESIRTEAEARSVPLFTQTFPAESWIKILPALSHSAYLVAEVTNTGSTPWLQGRAHLFVGADLVGDAAVPTTAPGEKVTLPLGIDDAIKVDRNVQVVSTERGVFSKQDVSDYQTVIELLNTRRTPVSVRVFDQVALSQQKEVEIKLTKVDPASLKDDKLLKEEGRLEWRTDLGPGEKRSLSFSYEVARPKGWKLWQSSMPGVSP